MASVLIVDDERDLRTIMSLSLQDEGFEIHEASSGAEAIELIAAGAPDVLILDVMMPGMDGFQLLSTLRERGLARSTRIVITTCRTSERDHLRGWELGADEYLTKPFDSDALANLVRGLLMLTPEDLRERRDAELQKAALLDRLESAMRRPRRAHSVG